MAIETWKPTISIKNLHKRAKFIHKIRQFFLHHHVLEVETPILSHYPVTDPFLENFETTYQNKQTLYMMTSPEYHMKRLLCANSGSIYQITKSFRNEEQGRLHNPEFTLLEWYEVSCDDKRLREKISTLLDFLFPNIPVNSMTYQNAFISVLNIDPMTISCHELQQFCFRHQLENLCQDYDRDNVLQILFSLFIEKEISQEQFIFVTDFPASQAALSKINPHNTQVSTRFELYYQHIELANGFYELQDPIEQQQRFQADNKKRRQIGLSSKPIDIHFISALESGLPDCSGVAIGVDRLLMIALQEKNIKDIISFNIKNS